MYENINNIKSYKECKRESKSPESSEVDLESLTGSPKRPGSDLESLTGRTRAGRESFARVQGGKLYVFT